MVILCPFVIQRRRARWHAETNYGHSAHVFAIQTQLCPMARRDKLWSFCALRQSRPTSPLTRGDLRHLPRSQDLSYWLLSHADERKYPSGYPYKHSFAICKTERLIACRVWHRLLHLLFPREQQVICMRRFYGHPRLSSTERNEISVLSLLSFYHQ